MRAGDLLGGAEQVGVDGQVGRQAKISFQIREEGPLKLYIAGRLCGGWR